MSKIRSMLWPVLRMLYPSFRVGPLAVVDVGLTWEDEGHVRSHFETALRYLTAVEIELLKRNLSRVAVVQHGYEGISVQEGKYGTSLPGPEATNPFYLACRLLWVAKYIEILRGRVTTAPTDRAARDESFDFVVTFCERHSEGDEWIRYFERERMRDLD